MQCGSCWAFSTTGSVEGINAIVTGELTSLSEQELIDCDTSRDHGCHGGLMDFAFGFIMQNGGLDTERDYKYLALEEACNSKKEHRHIVTIDGYQDVPPNDEKSLLKVSTDPCSCHCSPIWSLLVLACMLQDGLEPLVVSCAQLQHVITQAPPRHRLQSQGQSGQAAAANQCMNVLLR